MGSGFNIIIIISVFFTVIYSVFPHFMSCIPYLIYFIEYISYFCKSVVYFLHRKTLNAAFLVGKVY